ncbi:hypothetical protein [Jannaschia sp. LMIT008]|uniref:hypothetical protein n=1 Tax=Jannaschia maritima TaxID=3032585 RepID=UPI002812799D|nr:hypothetical protein [Jannaschia sp. LMIT008]
MHHLTLRNVDPAIDAALREAAARDGLSKSEVARRALAKGLGVTIKRRDISGLGDRLMDRRSREILAAQDWITPDLSDADYDEMEAEAEKRGG